jgi:chemotaxis protein CheC
MPIELTEMQKSALTEAANIGSGHAARVLSEIMGRKVMIKIPSIEILTFEELSLGMKSKGDLIGAGISVNGDIQASLTFVMKKAIAGFLCNMLMHKKESTSELSSERERSAIAEIGNIITSSYMSAISQLTGLSAAISTPKIFLKEADLAKAIKKSAGKSNCSDGMMCVKTVFTQIEMNVEGYLVFIPSQNSLGVILNALKV